MVAYLDPLARYTAFTDEHVAPGTMWNGSVPSPPDGTPPPDGTQSPSSHPSMNRLHSRRQIHHQLLLPARPLLLLRLPHVGARPVRRRLESTSYSLQYSLSYRGRLASAAMPAWLGFANVDDEVRSTHAYVPCMRPKGRYYEYHWYAHVCVRARVPNN
jgi:hypothetical protein